MFSDTFRRPDKGRLKGLNIGEGNRLKEYNGTEYTHDAPGNLIYRQLPNGENQYFVYDTENQLVRAEIKKPAGNTEIWEYAYDPFGRRLSKERKDKLAWVSTEPKRTHFVWDGTKLLQEYTYKGNYTYVYTDQDSYEPLAQVFYNGKDEQQYLAYFHTDQIGIPREMTDQFGNLLWYGEYTAWGKLASQTKVYPLVHQPFRLQNQYFDSETGLHYNFFRYYEPDTGRFINQDPIGLMGGDNLYSFAPNAQGWIDLLGLSGFKFRPLRRGGLGMAVKKVLLAINKRNRERCGKCNSKQQEGNKKGVNTGGIPNSVYTQTATRGNQKIAIQNVIYDNKGRAIAHVDFKPHHGQSAGHAHVFKQPGNPASGHGASNFDSVLPPNKVPAEWSKLPSNVIPHTPIGHK